MSKINISILVIKTEDLYIAQFFVITSVHELNLAISQCPYIIIVLTFPVVNNPCDSLPLLTQVCH